MDHSRIMPTQDDVVRKTERITKKIQELLISAQEGIISEYLCYFISCNIFEIHYMSVKFSVFTSDCIQSEVMVTCFINYSYSVCAEKITAACNDMATLFPLVGS